MLDIQKIGTLGSDLAPRIRNLAFCLALELPDYGGSEHGSDEA